MDGWMKEGLLLFIPLMSSLHNVGPPAAFEWMQVPVMVWCTTPSTLLILPNPSPPPLLLQSTTTIYYYYYYYYYYYSPYRGLRRPIGYLWGG